MFGFFDSWKTYSTEEIKKGNYLGKAKEASYKEFFNKNTFNDSSNWTILYVDGDKVYWSKANQQKVYKNDFFVTNRNSIEENFLAIDSSKNKSLLQVLNEYIRKDLDLIDGCLYSVINSSFYSIRITPYTDFDITLDVLLSVTPTTLNPETREEKEQFHLLVHPHNFALIKFK